MTMKQIAVLIDVLAGVGVFEFGAVLSSGKGGSWAFPTVLVFAAILAIGGFVLLVRAQRAQSRHH